MGVLMILMLVAGLFACSSPPSMQVHRDNLLGGIRIEYPSHWDLTLDERLNNRIIMEAQRGLLRQEAARIEILFGSNPFTPTVALESAIERVIEQYQSNYGSDAVGVVSSPELVQVGAYEVISATIAIETTSLEKSPFRNQWGHEDSDLQQIVQLYFVSNPDLGRSASIDIFTGGSEELNEEAREIANSIISYVAGSGS